MRERGGGGEGVEVYVDERERWPETQTPDCHLDGSSSFRPAGGAAGRTTD